MKRHSTHLQTFFLQLQQTLQPEEKTKNNHSRSGLLWYTYSIIGGFFNGNEADIEIYAGKKETADKA